MRANCNEKPVRKLQFYLNIYRSAGLGGGFLCAREKHLFLRGPGLLSSFVLVAERRVNAKSGCKNLQENSVLSELGLGRDPRRRIFATRFFFFF